MPINLSEDLRHAVDLQGSPLRLVDPRTGEIFVLLRESEAARYVSALEAEESALRESQIAGSRLRELAEHHPPPPAWFDGDEEDLF